MVLRQAVSNVPAMTLWTDDYLRGIHLTIMNIIHISILLFNIFRPCSLAKQGDNALGSVRQRSRPCRVQQRAKKSHYQSKVFVCVSNVCADRLLISSKIESGINHSC